jgi:tRNA G18 (ribose-2'-O)-methylase SpoU
MTRGAIAGSEPGFFAIGIYHPKAEVNVGSLWRSATLYGAAFVFTVGRRYEPQCSDTPVTPKRIPYFAFDGMDDLTGNLPWSCPLIAVEMTPFSQPLYQFRHPERAAYLLGAEDHGLPRSISDRCHDQVVIEGPVAESMNVACAGSVLLHDRYVKADLKAARPS